MKNKITRKPEILLPLSIGFAREYLDHLSRMQNDIHNVQGSEELTIIHRALWTALIIEVARLFDTHHNAVSFKKLPKIKAVIDKHHSKAIIGKIIKTRKTFTAHFDPTGKIVVSAQEICNSNLRQILEEMSKLKVVQ
jgi:hypothetical protein